MHIYREYLKNNLKEKRIMHSINVMNEGIMLSKHYNADVKKVKIASLLHDCGKKFRPDRMLNYCKEHKIEIDKVSLIQPDLLHGKIGENICKVELNIDDPDILSAVKYHTTGCENMSIIEKIVFVADYIEPTRNFETVGISRKLAYEDIDKAMLHILNETIEFLIRENRLIHQDTIDARNYLLSLLYLK